MYNHIDNKFNTDRVKIRWMWLFFGGEFNAKRQPLYLELFSKFCSQSQYDYIGHSHNLSVPYRKSPSSCTDCHSGCINSSVPAVVAGEGRFTLQPGY